MPFYDPQSFSEFADSAVIERLKMERENRGVVFSAKGSFNPTSLAVEHSLREIFDEFQPMIAGELRALTEEEDDPITFESA